MAEPILLLFDTLPTPLGAMVVVAGRDGKLRAAIWTEGDVPVHGLLTAQYGRNGYELEKARDPFGMTDALRRYFKGDLSAIDALPSAARGTEFQRLIWNALRTIPCGATISYGELARRVGRPGAARAVGLANGSNPVGIVVPCHRVIGANGTLTGYGGGIERKRWLLAHEKALGMAELAFAAR